MTPLINFGPMYFNLKISPVRFEDVVKIIKFEKDNFGFYYGWKTVTMGEEVFRLKEDFFEYLIIHEKYKSFNLNTLNFMFFNKRKFFGGFTKRELTDSIYDIFSINPSSFKKSDKLNSFGLMFMPNGKIVDLRKFKYFDFDKNKINLDLNIFETCFYEYEYSSLFAKDGKCSFTVHFADRHSTKIKNFYFSFEQKYAFKLEI